MALPVFPLFFYSLAIAVKCTYFLQAKLLHKTRVPLHIVQKDLERQDVLKARVLSSELGKTGIIPTSALTYLVALGIFCSLFSPSTSAFYNRIKVFSIRRSFPLYICCMA